jgi:CyaY protein
MDPIAGGRMATLAARFISPILSTMPAAPAATPLSDAEYDRLTRGVLTAIESALDQWLQDDLVDIDSQRSGGMLELTFPSGTKVIVNTQPPLQELWLAARAGGRHFRYVAPDWLDTRDASEFFAVLSREVSAQAGLPLSIVG